MCRKAKSKDAVLQVADGLLGEPVVVGVDDHLVGAVGPRALEERELLLGRVERRAESRGGGRSRRSSRPRDRQPPAPWRGSRRSSFHVTAWPLRSFSMRRPVTMPVWLGRVSVCSTSARAFNVEAPWRMSRCSVGVPSRPSRVIAVGLRPSSEMTTTWWSGSPTRCAEAVTALAGDSSAGGRDAARARRGDGDGQSGGSDEAGADVTHGSHCRKRPAASGRKPLNARSVTSQMRGKCTPPVTRSVLFPRICGAGRLRACRAPGSRGRR